MPENCASTGSQELEATAPKRVKMNDQAGSRPSVGTVETGHGLDLGLEAGWADGTNAAALRAAAYDRFTHVRASES